VWDSDLRRRGCGFEVGARVWPLVMGWRGEGAVGARHVVPAVGRASRLRRSFGGQAPPRGAQVADAPKSPTRQSRYGDGALESLIL